MKKLSALRQHIIKSLPDLNTDPDKFLSFIEDGNIIMNRGPNLTHKWDFVGQFILVEFTQDIDVLVVAILQWLRRYEPDQRPEDAVQFEAEITSETTLDLILRIRLSERVIVNVDDKNQELNATHTMPSFDEPTYSGPWSLYLQDGERKELLATWDNGPWGANG